MSDVVWGKRDNYFHYLHHRFFTVNFGHESVPLDKWFGSFFDGSDEAHEVLLEKRRASGKSTLKSTEPIKD